MAKRLFIIITIIANLSGYSQQFNPAIDSLHKQLKKANSAGERVKLLGDLSRVYINENFAASDSIGKLMIQEAELSRDRKLMVEALLVNGERNSYFAAKKENLAKTIDFYNQALEFSKQNKLDKETALSYLSLSSVYRIIPDADKAFEYINQATSYISTLEDDSLKVLAQIELGNVYGLKREKLLSLRNYLSGLRLAEETKNAELKYKCYNALTAFYNGIDDNDKAIDYAVKALNILDEIKEGSSPYYKPVAMIAIGNLYSQKKSYDIANHYFQQSIRIADSLHYEPLKIPAYLGILNNNLNSGKPAEALNFLNKDTQIKAFAVKFGLSQQIDYAYGYIYTDLGKYDSAKYYYARAASFFENSSTEASTYVYYYQLGKMYKLSGNSKMAIENFLKAKEIADKVADPERIQIAAKELDSVYMNTGDYRQSKLYNAMYYQYKDSLDKLGKEKDLLQAEAADEQQRETRRLKEEEDNLKRKNNIQYTAITIGIAALLIMLIVLGMFKVSAGFIKAISFFTFLMLFEFIFLVFKKNIHSITHGEPWKDLAFMIALAALLVPLHHWLEHRVLKYLTSHNRLTSTGAHIKNKLFKRNKE
jgi:tetratricopeptide (TPR) repeat protein